MRLKRTGGGTGVESVAKQQTMLVQFLEGRMSPEDRLLLIVSTVRSVNTDRYMKILREYGFLPKEAIVAVHVPETPDGLDEAELDAFI